MSIFRVFLTFDDGLLDSCLRAAEYLAKRGVKATFFIVPGWINRSCHIVDFFNLHEAHLTWDDCRYLLRLGHLVGSHSATHLDFNECDSNTINREIIEAKMAIESELQIQCHAFASPFNRFSREIALLATKLHKFIRFGPHMPNVLRQMRPEYPVYNSLSLVPDVLHRTLHEGFPFLSYVATNGGVILQIHGFNGQGWGSLPFTLFKDFVDAHLTLLSGDDMLTFFEKKGCTHAADTIH